MNSIKQKKRLHSQTVEDSTSIATTKTQSKKLKQINENVAVKSVESNTKKQKVGEEASEAKQSTVNQRKRMKSKERKLAAIAKVKEAGGVPKPLWPSKSGKSKLAKTNAQDSKTTDAVDKSPPAVSSSGGVRTVEDKLKKQQEMRLEKKILRKEEQQQDGQYKVENVTLTTEQMKERIEAIQSRGSLTKTGKRKLGMLKKKLAIADGTYVPKPPIEKNDSDKLSKSQKRKLKRKNENSTGNTDSESKDSKPDVEKPVDIQAFKKKVKKNQPQEEQVKPVKKSAQVNPTNKLDSKSQEQTKGAVTQVKLNGKKKEGKDKGAVKNKKIQESKEGSDDEEEDEEESDSEDGQENKTTVPNSKAKKPKLSSTHDIKSNDEDDDDEDDDDEDDDDEDDDDEDEDDEDVAVDEAESDENEEAEDVEDEDDEEEEDEDDKEEENEDDAGDDSDVEGEAQKKGDAKSQKKTNKGLTENGTTVKKQSPQNQDQEKKKRYVLFVGNIPFDTKSDDLKNHFLTKVSQVISVRIPTKTGTQVPRGFAYVEVTNDIDYEKGLSLHHSFINGRRINVEYTLSGSKQVGQRKDLVSKNKKLDALRKAGKLAGSQKHDQKRSVRRFKQRNQDRLPF